MSTPKVSVITPVFNSAEFIAQTISSVQNQTLTDWEMILVDDVSTDTTLDVIKAIAKTDSRIRLIELEINSGAGIARQTALDAATGRYIAFLDSDDIWKPEKLQAQLNFMQQTNQPFTFSFYDWIDRDGKLLHKRIEAPINLSYGQLFFCNYVGNLTGIYDSQYFGKIAIPSIRKRQDWIIWLQVLKQVGIAKPVPESLAFYRIHENSMSASKINLLKYNYRVYRDFQKLNRVFAVFCMLIFLFTQLVIKPRYAKNLKVPT